jgi:predicted  nucleic acid-binding Zn-ribbon protein
LEVKILSNPYEKQGFDFDPETIDLMDAILQNILDDEELEEEFKKLKFIKKLNGEFNDAPGPLKQLIEKMGTMEREFTRVTLDMQRAVSDLHHVIDAMQKAVDAKTQKDLQGSIDQMQGVRKRLKHYTWNQEQNGA